MDVNEALQWADQWTEGQTFYEGMQGWRVVCAVLAAEVRRLRENLTQLLTGLECRNIELAVNENTPDAFKLVGELIAHRAKQNTGYPPSLDDETKKLQNLLSENARLSILNHLYEQISAGREEFSAMDMDYWDSSHDKLLEAIQNKLDDDTRKMVLELCDIITRAGINDFETALAKQIIKKLGAGDE